MILERFKVSAKDQVLVAEAALRARATITSSRGFNVILWRDGELRYALVSDVDVTELSQLAAKLAGGA
jgi:anti-sigma factor RsiW